MNIAAIGEFWLPETPDETVPGSFTANDGEQPEAVLAGALVEDPRVTRSATGGLMYARGAAGGVQASLPITMQGRLDSGDSVTLIKAQNWGDPVPPFGVPRYQAHYAIVGDRNTSGPDQVFSSMRFRFGDPYWLGHLQGSETAAVGEDGSTLSVESADDGNWLLYTPATPLTMQRLETMVESGCLTLAELALDQQFDARTHRCASTTGMPGLQSMGPTPTRPQETSITGRSCLAKNSHLNGSPTGSRSTTHWTASPAWQVAPLRGICRRKHYL